MGIAAFFLWSIGAHLVRFPLALWIAPKISIKVNSTMTELLERFYGRLASIIGAVVLIVSCLSISEVAATGYVGTAAWNANKFVAAAVVIAISIALTCIGGLFGVASSRYPWSSRRFGQASAALPAYPLSWTASTRPS